MKNSKITNSQIVDLVRNASINFNTGHLRLGQSFMISLSDINHELYQEITSTDADCFYNDKKIPKFLDYLQGKINLIKL